MTTQSLHPGSNSPQSSAYATIKEVNERQAALVSGGRRRMRKRHVMRGGVVTIPPVPVSFQSSGPHGIGNQVSNNASTILQSKANAELDSGVAAPPQVKGGRRKSMKSMKSKKSMKSRKLMKTMKSKKTKKNRRR